MFLQNMVDNLNEFITKISQVYSQDDVEIYLNLKKEDGSVQVVNLKSIGKFYNEIYDKVGEAIYYFNRTLYVDINNGNDSNTGDGTNPLQTFKRALEITPPGAKVNIIFVGDYPIQASDYRRYMIKNQDVTLSTSNETYKINVVIDDIDFDNNRSVIGIFDGGSLTIACDVEISMDDTYWNDDWKTWVTDDYASFIGVSNGNFKVSSHLTTIGYIPKIKCNSKSALCRSINGNITFDSMRFNNQSEGQLLQLRSNASVAVYDPDRVGSYNESSDTLYSVRWNPSVLEQYIDGIVLNNGTYQNIETGAYLLPNITSTKQFTGVNSNNVYVPNLRYETHSYTGSSDIVIEKLDVSNILDTTNGTQFKLYGDKIANGIKIIIVNTSSHNITIKNNSSNTRYTIETKNKSDIILRNSEYIELRLINIYGSYVWKEI